MAYYIINLILNKLPSWVFIGWVIYSVISLSHFVKRKPNAGTKGLYKYSWQLQVIPLIILVITGAGLIFYSYVSHLMKTKGSGEDYGILFGFAILVFAPVVLIVTQHVLFGIFCIKLKKSHETRTND